MPVSTQAYTRDKSNLPPLSLYLADNDDERVGDDGVERLPAAVGPLPLRRRQGPPRPLQDALAAGHRPLQQRRRQL